jgi:hypothetical protein
MDDFGNTMIAGRVHQAALGYAELLLYYIAGSGQRRNYTTRHSSGERNYGIAVAIARYGRL